MEVKLHLFVSSFYCLSSLYCIYGYGNINRTKEKPDHQAQFEHKLKRHFENPALPVPSMSTLPGNSKKAKISKKSEDMGISDIKQNFETFTQDTRIKHKPRLNSPNRNKGYQNELDKKNDETLKSESLKNDMTLKSEAFKIDETLKSEAFNHAKKKANINHEKLLESERNTDDLETCQAKGKDNCILHDFTKHIYDYVIIGAGPAGLQMAYFLQRAGRDYIVLERANHSGSFFSKYPIHDKLISINKRYTGQTNKEFNLRHDWNSLLSDDESLLFKAYSKEFFPDRRVMVKYLNDYAEKLNLNVQYDTSISNIRKYNVSIEGKDDHMEIFAMQDQLGNTYQARYLLMATGMWKPNKPRVHGMEETIGYEDLPKNPDIFEGKNVLILGHGNSAFETAQSIYGHANVVHVLGRSRVKLAWETHYVGDLRGVNNELLDTYQLKSLDGVVEGPIEELAFSRHGDKIQVTHQAGGDRDNFALRLEYDAVIRCLGWQYDRSLFNQSLLSLTHHPMRQKYLTLTEDYQVQGVPNMYMLGTASHFVDYRESSGGFIHGFRYTAEALHHILEYKNHQVLWPSSEIKLQDITTYLVKRANEASGIYQMFGVLCDIVLFNSTSPTARYLEAFPVKLLPEVYNFSGHHESEALVMILEYGRNFSGPGKDVFRKMRSVGQPDQAHRSNFLHPVFYHYEHIPSNNEMKEWKDTKNTLPKPKRLHHTVEDFLAFWNSQTSHVLPLRRFIETAVNSDIKSRFSEDCFIKAMLYQTVPKGCNSYIMGNGLVKPYDSWQSREFSF